MEDKIKMKKFYSMVEVKPYPYCPKCEEELEVVKRGDKTKFVCDNPSHKFFSTNEYKNVEKLISDWNRTMYKQFEEVQEGKIVLWILLNMALFLTLTFIDAIHFPFNFIPIATFIIGLNKMNSAKKLFELRIEDYKSKINDLSSTDEINQISLNSIAIEKNKELEKLKDNNTKLSEYLVAIKDREIINELLDLLKISMLYEDYIERQKLHDVSGEMIGYTKKLIDLMNILREQEEYPTDKSIKIKEQSKNIMRKYRNIYQHLYDRVRLTEDMDIESYMKVVEEDAKEYDNYLRMKSRDY